MLQETRAWESMAAYDVSFPTHTDEGGPVRLNGVTVSATFFDLLGARRALGRTFAAEESEPGRNPVAVVGHALGRERFGGSPAAALPLVALQEFPTDRQSGSCRLKEDVPEPAPPIGACLESREMVLLVHMIAHPGENDGSAVAFHQGVPCCRPSVS